MRYKRPARTFWRLVVLCSLSLCLLLTGCQNTQIRRITNDIVNVINQPNQTRPQNKPKAKINQHKTAGTIDNLVLMPEAQANKLLKSNYKIVSEDVFNTLDRSEKAKQLDKDIQTLGYGVIDISPTLNQVQYTAMSYSKKQFELIDAYSTMTKNHKDVQSFLKANAGKSKAEINQAIQAFDKTATQESEKIGPKLKAYEAANRQTFKANGELTALIAGQILYVGALAWQDPEAFLKTEGLFFLFNINKVSKATSLMMDRLKLAQYANTLIADDKAIIEITQQIQKQQNERISTNG